MIEKKKVKIGELFLIFYLTVSSGLGLFFIVIISWVTLQMKNDPDPSPILGLLYALLIIAQMLGIVTGLIIWLRHLIKNTDYKKLTMMPLALWILSVIMYFVI